MGVVWDFQEILPKSILHETRISNMWAKLPSKYTHFRGKGLRKTHPGLLLSGKISGKVTGPDFHILFCPVVNYST